MSRVTVSGLTKRFEGKPPSLAVDDLELELEEGEFLALLGPSGCGKTTTLRCIAGLERPGHGRITIGDSTVFDSDRRINEAPDKRQIGMVFQSYALWPHMTVRKNIGYPLRARRRREALRSGRIEEVARLVECDALLSRYPAQLSGGQQQRVALARALAAEPAVILFDEPLSNLDARLRDQMRTELHRLHRNRPFTSIYVTHDQTEALALGQRIAIMRAGRIEQLGTPTEVFEKPATEYVAGFIGLGNRLVCTYTDGQWMVEGEAPSGEVGLAGRESPTALRFGMEDARLVRADDELSPGELGVAATVVDAEFAGRYRRFVVDVGGAKVRAQMPRAAAVWIAQVRRGDHLVLALSHDRTCAFAAGTATADTDEQVGSVSELAGL